MILLPNQLQGPLSPARQQRQAQILFSGSLPVDSRGPCVSACACVRLAVIVKHAGGDGRGLCRTLAGGERPPNWITVTPGAGIIPPAQMAQRAVN